MLGKPKWAVDRAVNEAKLYIENWSKGKIFLKYYMCGFIAVFNKDGLALETIKYKNALNYLNHRGPDFQDIFVNSNNTLFQGHNRLAILDLSKAGNQPYKDLNKNFSLVFNGQIYNHNKIRKLTKNKNIQYLSSCDTETLFIELIKNKEIVLHTCLECGHSYSGMKKIEKLLLQEIDLG